MKKIVVLFLIFFASVSAFSQDMTSYAYSDGAARIVQDGENSIIYLGTSVNDGSCITLKFSKETASAAASFYNGEKFSSFSCSNLVPVHEATFYFAALGFVPDKIVVNFKDDRSAITGLSVKTFENSDFPPLSPLPADLSQILAVDEHTWRYSDWEVYQWESFPGILVFDTLNYDIQSNIFKRLSFFVEKRGFTGRIHSFSTLSGKADWNGHNYLSADLAEFFNEAERTGIVLTSGERYLRELLLSCGIIEKSDSGYTGNDHTGVISISRESGSYLRGLLLTHEGFHGLYYAVPAVRELVEDGWDSLADPSREIWLDYLRTSKGWNYNYEDMYLVKNELFGYMMQQRYFAEYFDNFLYPRVLKNCSEKSAYYSEHKDEIRTDMIKLAENLNSFLGTGLGLSAGNLIYIREIK
ncbi:MAG: hypothetical protein MJ215_01695 [Spirochaetia bacterium]|nr:hypothetical protein [Spirochaetia bacterium]